MGLMDKLREMVHRSGPPDDKARQAEEDVTRRAEEAADHTDEQVHRPPQDKPENRW